ncbi:hypothetical protein EV401DRAFT_1881731 [Pisolithus croceorrhizus]|nr:hypothetical protein EV401DRAFT_1881731 [Pisolithus croceorrhizus]
MFTEAEQRKAFRVRQWQLAKIEGKGQPPGRHNGAKLALPDEMWTTELRMYYESIQRCHRKYAISDQRGRLVSKVELEGTEVILDLPGRNIMAPGIARDEISASHRAGCKGLNNENVGRLTAESEGNQNRFTGTRDELEELYLACAAIELRGVEVVKPMHASMNEMLVRHDTAVCRITSYPSHITGMVNTLTSLPMNSRGPNWTCFIIASGSGVVGGIRRRRKRIGKCEDMGKPRVWQD